MIYDFLYFFITFYLCYFYRNLIYKYFLKLIFFLLFINLPIVIWIDYVFIMEVLNYLNIFIFHILLIYVFKKFLKIFNQKKKL